MVNEISTYSTHLNASSNIEVPHDSAEGFIRDCLYLLQSGVSPNRALGDKCSLVETVFQYLGERRFDGYLGLLLPLIEELRKKSANFKERVAEIDHGITCIDFTCQQVAFIYWKQLAKENHVGSSIAQRIFQLVDEDVGYNAEYIDDCLAVGNLQKVTFLIRSTSPHPNEMGLSLESIMETVFWYLAAGFYEDILQDVPDLIQVLLECHVDPNLQVSSIGTLGEYQKHTCQQIAFSYWKQLVKKNHISSPIARHIVKLVCQNVDYNGEYLADCLAGANLQQVTSFLRSTRLNPNRMELFGQSIMQRVFQDLAAGFYEDILQYVPDLIQVLLENRGDPNLQFPSISIKGKGKYQNLTCLHIAYLYWQGLKKKGLSNKAKLMKQAFLLLLQDPRIDVTLRFTEISLYDRDSGHFSDDLYEGDYLEEGNLAHYALADGDFGTAKKVLSLARNLIGSTCFTVTRKWMLDALKNCYMASFIDPRSQQEVQLFDAQLYQPAVNALKNSSLTGILAHLYWSYPPGEKGFKPKISTVVRYGRVSLCHIAARRLDFVACTFLTSIGDNGGIPDTDRRSVIDYAKLHQEDDLIWNKREKIAKVVFKALKQAQPLPPVIPQAFYTLYQDGYEAMYHPGTKCSIVREVLHEGMLKAKVSNSEHKSYRQHPSIPKINRASLQDFKVEGVICGHAKPRADSLSSGQSLYDVGYLTNILAQNSVLNNGLWKKIEKQIRDLTQIHLCLHVYTGGVFTSSVDVKGPKIVSYP